MKELSLLTGVRLTRARQIGLGNPLPDDLERFSKPDCLIVGQLSALVCGGNKAIFIRLGRVLLANLLHCRGKCNV